jgi:hypothetical protein
MDSFKFLKDKIKPGCDIEVTQAEYDRYYELLTGDVKNNYIAHPEWPLHFRGIKLRIINV